MMDRDEWPGGERRSPASTQPDYWTLNEVSSRLRRSLTELRLAPGGIVLDVGCGNQPYRPFFEERGLRYLGVDEGLFQVAVVARNEALPFRADSVDLVVSSQVLEHVEDPRKCMREAHRILKPGGVLILSVPFVWEVHNYPRDYWRFSDQAIRQLLTGFEILTLDPASTSLQAILQAFNLWLHRSYRQSFWRDWLIRCSNRVIRGPASRTRDRLLPATYFCVAKKAQ